MGCFLGKYSAPAAFAFFVLPETAIVFGYAGIIHTDNGEFTPDAVKPDTGETRICFLENILNEQEFIVLGRLHPLMNLRNNVPTV